MGSRPHRSPAVPHPGSSVGVAAAGTWARAHRSPAVPHGEGGTVTVAGTAAAVVDAARLVPPTRTRISRVVERNVLAYRAMWPLLAAGLLEPVLFLGSIGLGVGALVDGVPGPGGRTLTYAAFVAPGLLAASAMMGAVMDTTFTVFVKLKYLRTYDAMLSTPLGVSDVALGELAWGVLRGTLHATAFAVTMAALGLVPSPWGVLAVPVTVVVGAAFAGLGLAAATVLRSWIDFDLVNLAVVPMFLFSGTFFPVSEYPGPVAAVARLSPLHMGTDVIRHLVVGELRWVMAAQVLALVALAVGGATVAVRRFGPRLQP